MIMANFNKNLIFSGGFFFLVLYSLFVMRPFRSAVAAQIGTSDLTYFLFLIVLVMLVANGIYSLIVSRIAEINLVLVIYGFFIINLFLYAFGNYIFPDSYWIGVSFYVWYNVFNFFVVSIFWARTINCFNPEDAKKYFGVISACGSAGAWVGSQSVYFFLSDLPVIAMLLASLALAGAVFFSSQLQDETPSVISSVSANLVSELTEQFSQIRANPLLRQLLFYAFIWTCLATALYFFSLEIISAYTSDLVEQREIFALADGIVTPVSFFVQLFLARVILRSDWLGVRFVIVAYGILFSLCYLVISSHLSNLLMTGSGVVIFLVISAVMRPFEYSLNKPARESVYTSLGRTEKYKSTVFIDTFANRFGDASGGVLFNAILLAGISIAVAPLAIIPLAACLSFVGHKIVSTKQQVS
jgi:AAA family ATP:ADP antiporter